MTFLKNTWYPIAWSREIEGELFSRTIINEPIVLYRKNDGTLVALSDTCPHRFAPLHRGKIKGDCIECPYHGLQFNSDGNCAHNPHGKIPAAAKVKAYPLIERDTLVWVWMGDPELADETLLPNYEFMNQPEKYAYTKPQVMHMPISYDLILDNLMDLTHAAFLHPENLGSEAVSRGKMEVLEDGGRISVKNLYPNGLPAPVFVATGACPDGELVDYWVDVHWTAPANMHFDAGVTPTGMTRDDGATLSSAQLLAPETETSTHYFWCQFHDYQRDNKDLTKRIEIAVTHAFANEDEPMIEAVQARMGGRDLWSMKPVLLATDAGAIRVRRFLEKLISEENGVA